MKKIKRKNLILFTVFILLISLFITYTARADSGFDSDWDFGGGGGGGFDSDWDFGGGGERGFDFEWDYDGFKSNSSEWDNNYGDNSIIITIVYVIIIVLGVVLLLTQFIKKQQRSSLSQQYYNELSDAAIKIVIPNFDKKEFCQKTFEIYKNIQESWMNFDEKKLRDLVTDEMYNMYTMQMNTMKIKNEKNIMKDFVMREAKIIDVKNDNGIISIKVFMNIWMHDYLIDANTGIIKRGTDSRVVDIRYVMTFVKSASIESTKDIKKCPNCGANLNLNASCKCEYCDSTIVVDANDYVMSKKENVGQRLL